MLPSIEKRAFGADAAAGAEVDADSVVDRMQYVAREKKRMMAANQAARIAYQARLIMATTAKEEPGGWRGPVRFPVENTKWYEKKR